jgi:hypothetical protein
LTVFGLPGEDPSGAGQGRRDRALHRPADKPLNFSPSADRRVFDIRTIDGLYTPKDQFFTTQHYGHPVVDPAAFRLKVSGLVERPRRQSR